MPSDQKIKESIENPSNVVPEDLAASNKYVLLVAGTYPLKISILEDKDGAAVWVPKSKAKEITDNGGSEKITFGFGDQVAEAWTRLITRYSSAEFKTNGWELVALKPYSAKEVKDAIAAIKTKSPELKAFVFQYFGHGDNDGKPFIRVSGRGPMQVSTKTGTKRIQVPSDANSSDPQINEGRKYYVVDIATDLKGAFPQAEHITMVLDGCNLGPSTKQAKGKLRVVVAEETNIEVIEGLFSQEYAVDKILIHECYDDYGNKIDPAIQAVNTALKNHPAPNSKGGPQVAGHKP